MANTKISNLPSAGALAGTEPLPIVQGGATKQTTVQDIANLVNVINKQNISIDVSSSITAVLNQYYIAIATATFTDPTPSEGKGFIVLVRNGTSTIGGTAYATAGTLIYRYYHSGAWVNYEFSTKQILKAYFDTLYTPIATANNLYITTGDQTKTATGIPTIANITGLSVTTVANKRYAFEGYLHVGCNAAGGIKFAVTAPTGSTISFGFMGPATPNLTNGIQQFISASATLTTSALANAISSLGIVKVYGEVSTGATTGTINFGFDSANNGQTSTIYQNGTNIVYTER